MPKVDLDRLSKIDWFAMCGQPLPNYAIDCVAVKSWSDASRLCSDESWERVGEDARGNITEYLTSRFPARYQGVWNKTVRELRPIIENKIVKNLELVQKTQGFCDEVIECVKWDVLLALMTEIYLDCKPPMFYLQLFEVYESGHFPCGWLGSWPQGQLQVL